MDNPFGITSKIVREALSISSEIMNRLILEFKEGYDVHLSQKLLSEIFSNLLESMCSRVFTNHLGYEVVKAEGDNDPDLFFTKINIPMEIKVTSGMTWRGGEFSKRAAHHLMVSRNDNFDKFFAYLVDMKSHEGLWESSMQRGVDYYAPRFSKDQVFELKKEIPIFIGEAYKNERGTVKLRRHSPDQKTPT